jgi:hypothetical protein
MKKSTPTLSVLALTVAFAAGCSSTTPSGPSTTTTASNAAASKITNIVVTFRDADKFTDARENWGEGTDPGYLDTISDYVKSKASAHVKPDQKLEVEFSDIDLAGDFNPARVGQGDVRIVRDIYMPRMALTFKLTGADGTVIKEGQRSLSDMNFMTNISIVDRSEPLFYDKELLADWIRDEFGS